MGSHELMVVVCLTAAMMLVSRGEREEMLIPSRLVVSYTPPVSVAVSKNHKTQVELHAQLNLSDLLNPEAVGLSGDDPDYVPLWLLCPGRLTAVPEPSRLLDIINDTVDVAPMDFMEGVSTVLVLRGKQLGHVRLMLYWELSNASLCAELPQDDDLDVALAMPASATSAQNMLHEDMEDTQRPTTSEDDEAIQSSSNRPIPSIQTTPTTAIMATRRPVLNKTFVIVRGSGRRNQSRRRKRSLTTKDTTARCKSNSTCNGQRDDVGTSSNKIVLDNGYYVHVLPEDTVLDEAMLYVAAIIAALNVFLIGFKVKKDEVKSILRRPIGPSLGFVCQLVMPLMSYTIAILMFKDEKTSQLGLLALATSPTAVLSNGWTLILNGNVHLSIVMTAISIACAFFVMPVWFNALDQRILPGTAKTIPRKHLLASAAILIVPLCISAILISIRPSVANFFAKIDRPAAAALMFALNSMALVTLWSMLPQMNWTMASAGLLLAFLGYALGWTLATLCRMERHSVASVSVATAFQNAGVAYAVVQLSLQKPDSDLSCVQPYVHIVATSALVLLLNCFSDAVYRRKHSKQADLSQLSSSPHRDDESGAGVAEPLMIRAVFAANASEAVARDKVNGHAETSYIPNEPLTSDIMDDANSSSTSPARTILRNQNTKNNDYNNGRRTMEGNKTFNTFGK